MNHWNYKAKHTFTLALNSRIAIGVLQTRGDGPNSPWWINLQGVGADPETGKPPACELDASLTDEQMKKAALDWAWPLLRAFVDEQVKAIGMAAMIMESICATPTAGER